ncbi:hypothetical protein POM88_004424 [Heracleum sosnowskyi]|uniref:DUF4371 domain-containing protein n=1 Tax=Heracleum sosnowskyi TaxID=360622 RepID=A0AAD8JJT8_9APIA|nr:hypothetical protein POM88_004424 [Heracleum sosnowskyi]
MSDQHSRERMKSLFSFYKRDGSDSTQTPAPASSNSVPVTPNQPNHLPIDEMEVIVESPNKPAIQTDPGLRDPICTFAVNQHDRIRKEFVGDAKFCILVDESLHVSHKEQMTIILRFVDEERYVRERFFKIVSVKDITSINLKEQICLVLSTNKLQMQNIRVSSTKTLLQALRDDGWANFLLSVQQFVDDHGLEMPNMGAAYSMEKFYPGDFDASEVRALRLQLEHYKCQVASNKDSLGARVPGKSSTLHPPLPACGLASWLLACLWMMSSILHMYQELGEAEVVSCIPKYDFQFVKQAALPSRADDVNTLSGCFCGFGDIEVISAGHRKRDIRIFTDYCRTRSDCREASRRTKDVSTKYEHVNKFWVVTAISQCADLKGVIPLLPFHQGRDIDELFNYAFKDGELGILGVGNSKNTVSV